MRLQVRSSTGRRRQRCWPPPAACASGDGAAAGGARSAADLAACLTHAGAAKRLQALPQKWLRQLYSCLAQHERKVAATDPFWGDLQAKAPIFRTEGGQGYTMATADSTPQLHMWDATFSQSERELFGGMRFLAASTWDDGCCGMLRRCFDIEAATASVLAPHLLAQYPAVVGTSSDEVLLRHVMFMFK